MEIPFERKNISCCTQIFSTGIVSDSSIECVVPDTQEDIVHILSSSFMPKIRSKDADFGRITIRGDLSAAVLYYSAKGIEKLDVTLPINADIPAPDCDNSCSVVADLKVASYDVKVINPRKIAVYAGVSVSISCYKNGEIQVFEAPSELPPKLMIKEEKTELNVIKTVTEKTFIIDEEFEAADFEASQLLSCTASYCCDGCEAVGEKLIARGHADIECISLCNGELKCRRFNAPFSQLFDIGSEGAGENEFIILSTGEYYEISDGHLIAEIHALIQLVSCNKEELRYVSDAFSCLNELDVEYETLLRSVCTECEIFADSIRLSYDAGEELSSVIYYKATCGKAMISDDSAAIPVTASVVFSTTGGEISAARLHGKVEFNSECKNASLVTHIADISATVVGSKIDFRADVRLEKKTKALTETLIVSSICEGDVLPLPDYSVYLVNNSDSDIWSIAKKYRSDPALIVNVNGLSEETRPKLLLVPVI